MRYNRTIAIYGKYGKEKGNMLKNWNKPRCPEEEELLTRLKAARERLTVQQMQIKEKKLPVLILFEGWGAAGKGSVLGKVIRNIDPRFFQVATMGKPTEEEARKPFLYRYFVQIPEAGKFKFLDGGWMDEITQAVLYKKTDEEHYKEQIESVRRFERQLTDNGYLVYMEDLIYPDLLETIKKRLDTFEIDGVLDSGVIEQLTEEKWYSPFPQFQTTERPDRAAMAILEGRIVLLCDNSPVALILPTDYNSFIQTSDDYYNRFEIASLGRFLRYIASFFAMTLPGLYLAVMDFHTQILPTTLLLSFAAARQGVPFPSIVEVLLMELSFELLREAGVRLPGAMGNTIGIVGGLIIGQAAVEANLVSPIVVIVVAFTALCSFAIPNEEFATAFRILKFFFIFLCAWLGFFGFLLCILTVLIHLAHLKSFGIPYLMPVVGADLTGYHDERDSMLRLPLIYLNRRPIFAHVKERIKLKRKG